MNATFNPAIAARVARDTYRPGTVFFEDMSLQTPAAETPHTAQKSFDFTGVDAAALNQKLLDIAQRNANFAFAFARRLAGATSLIDIVQLQAAFWHAQFRAFAAQAEEVRALSSDLVADVAERSTQIWPAA